MLAHRFASGGDDFVDDDLGRTDVVDDDLRPVPGELERMLAADTACRTGDDGDPAVVQSHPHNSFSGQLFGGAEHGHRVGSEITGARVPVSGSAVASVSVRSIGRMG